MATIVNLIQACQIVNDRHRFTAYYDDSDHDAGTYGRRRYVTVFCQSDDLFLFQYSPFVKLSNGTYSGLCIELLDALARRLNFR